MNSLSTADSRAAKIRSVSYMRDAYEPKLRSCEIEVLADTGEPDVRIGSNSEVRARNSEVRFSLKNRHCRAGLSGPRSAISRHGGAPAECPLSRNGPRCWGRIATSRCKRTGRPFAAGFQWTNLTPHVVPCRHTTWQRVVVLKPSDDRSKSEELGRVGRWC
jgi:hypothetical protein